MKYLRAFTLVELLIALTVFAILATITSTILYNTFNTRTRVNQQTDRLNALELAISIIQQDTRQSLVRGIRGNEMQPFAPFIGRLDYFELTRDGFANPQNKEQRSTLKRIAYLCSREQLIRRTWPALDTPDRKNHQDKILVDGLKECHFNYLTQNLQFLPEWREHAVTQNQKIEPMPKAIQMNLTLKDWGEMNLLFVIPGAVYNGVK